MSSMCVSAGSISVLCLPRNMKRLGEDSSDPWEKRGRLKFRRASKRFKPTEEEDVGTVESGENEPPKEAAPIPLSDDQPQQSQLSQPPPAPPHVAPDAPQNESAQKGTKSPQADTSRPEQQPDSAHEQIQASSEVPQEPPPLPDEQQQQTNTGESVETLSLRHTQAMESSVRVVDETQQTEKEATPKQQIRTVAALAADVRFTQSAQPALGRHKGGVETRVRLRKPRLSEYPRTARPDDDEDEENQKSAPQPLHRAEEGEQRENREETERAGDVATRDEVEAGKGDGKEKGDKHVGVRKSAVQVREERARFREERERKIREKREAKQRKQAEREERKRQKEEEKQRRLAEKQAQQIQAVPGALDQLIPADLPPSEQAKQLIQHAVAVARRKLPPPPDLPKGFAKGFEGVCTQDLALPEECDTRTHPKNKEARQVIALLTGPVKDFLDDWASSLVADKTELESKGEEWKALDIDDATALSGLHGARRDELERVMAGGSLVDEVAEEVQVPMAALEELEFALGAVSNVLIPSADEYLARIGAKQPPVIESQTNPADAASILRGMTL
eukprot:comp11411_c0_seq1/m.5800 comp11411_c0_seq1/g.5800  ORF comp11411_c0_seq1/g.5800 comp11411_c0_seq1/m.5800 type:complete len:564 (-) comp11411_c0_seq1:16-1707(-)